MSSAFEDGLKAEVVRLLLANGYVEIPTDLTIGDIQLEAPGLWESPPESMDLSLIVGRPDSRESTLRLYWLVQRLARALDSVGSRRTVTVIVIGRPSVAAGLNELLELARVLVVDGSLATERMIGPLLRLRLPASASIQLNGIHQVAETISGAVLAKELLRLVSAATVGENVVTDRYRGWLEESFVRPRSERG